MTPARCLTIALLTLALAGSLRGLLSAQSNPLVGTGFVSGQVVAGGTNKPVPGAVVTLYIVSSNGPRGPAPEVIADAQGRFVFSGVPAGEFQLRASRNGWQTGALGLDGPFQPQGMVVSAASPGNGQVFKVAAGERFRATVPVWPNAVIRGQVTDEAGEPIAGAYVRAMRWYLAGSRRQLSGTLTFADDRGFFTLSVAPGEYVVGAASEQVRVARDPVSGAMQRFVFRDTFFPNASGTFDAVPFTVKPGDERNGMTVRMQLVRAMRLTGVLTARDAGRQPARLQVIAMNEGVRAHPTQAVDPLGRFMFGNLPAGRYILRTNQGPFPASDPAAPAELWVSTQVDIGNRDVDVSIESHRKILVSGRVEFEGTAPIPSRQAGISAGVMLIRDDELPSDIGAELIPVGPDGRFTVATTPGRFVVSAGITAVDFRNQPPQAREALLSSSRVWSLRSAMLAGRDVADNGLAITSDITNLVLTFTDRRTALTGRVTTREGSVESAYLLVFPSDEKLWIDYGFGRRLRVIRLPATGAFSIDGLPEGDYLLASFRSSATAREVRNPAFLRALAGSAKRVALREGESVTQAIELLSSPPVKALNAALAPPSIPPDAVERAVVREIAAGAAPAGATITGTVVDASSKQPLASVRVGITVPVMQAPLVGGAFTDDRGRFTLAVPAGQHTLYVSKPTYVTTVYGAARAGDTGTPVTVANDQVLSDLTVPLVRGAAIGGRVLDHNGQPITDAQLTIRAYRWQARGRELVPAQGASITGIRTNALGEYRAWGFPPGDYIVQVNPQGGVPQVMLLTTQADLDAAQRPGAGTPVPQRAHVGYAPTYYPNTLDSASAAIVTLRSGDDRVIDIQVSLIPMAVVAGVARTPDGAPARLSLTLTPNDPSALPQTRTLFSTVDDSGAFTFRDVPPGRYRLAPSAVQRSSLSGALDVFVDGDRSGLVLDLVPGASVSGQLGGDARAGARQPNVRVALTPLTTFVQPAQAMTSAIEPDSRFSFPNVPPGRYRLELTGPTNVVRPRVAAQIVNGVDTIETGLEIKGGEQIDVAVEVTASEARLAGRVIDRAGRPLVQQHVVLFPADAGARLPPSRRIFTVRPDQNGRYALPDVPAGEYLITAVADIAPGDWFDPDVLARLAPTAAPLRIRRGDTLEIDLETQ